MYSRTRAQGFGAEVKRRIMLGTYALRSGYYDAYYAKAQKVRALIHRDFERAFERVDLLLSPTAPTAAFALGEKTKNPLDMYRGDVFTLGCNLAGLPGMSVPCGFTGAGLPIGMQLLARPLDEVTMLRAAAAYEREAGTLDARGVPVRQPPGVPDAAEVSP
jgi:aspartyl-tRNA(Asn)/glutamyl-tRNA(Gln) amidotransferase subunit A